MCDNSVALVFDNGSGTSKAGFTHCCTKQGVLPDIEVKIQYSWSSLHPLNTIDIENLISFFVE